ncbi:M23 family metallopeptidase [Streptomyces yaizuensis]|uniref:M23 family metallopeptidase n=1 Tax=Streptomyces yaizuensis TaxID=2989713 RepID=A0ABQ5P4X5_9ACTN|nr:M23 family metallopeptidase [Streptomyces sp. YSPA8]GLF97654.1 M23 family metallopeptidase [Streptomyces sp. YSPA8]
MNDQHAHAGHVGHDDYTTGSFGIDPLFGALPDSSAGYEAGHSGQYDSTAWDTGAHQGVGYEVHPPAEQVQQYSTAYDGTGQWDATAWNQSRDTGQFASVGTAFSYDTTGQWVAGSFDSGSYDATAWNSDGDTGAAEGSVPAQFTPEGDFAPEFGSEFALDPAVEHLTDAGQEFAAGMPGYDDLPDPGADHAFQPGYTGSYDTDSYDADSYATGAYGDASYEAGFPEGDDAEALPETDFDGPAAGAGTGPGGIGDTASLPVVTDDRDDYAYTPELAPVAAAEATAPRTARRSGGGSRGRRRTPAKRSALLTVAVPSACVMGVAGIAAASVTNLAGDDTKKTDTKVTAIDQAALAAKSAVANNKMDTQLAALSAGARDFGDRASRTQERIDLKARQEADRKKREDEAKRREALRPKFAVPVESRGLSTYYGESGVNWMALHTGIDFPVPYGTNVFAATDGTVRTQYNSAYGNMIILTAPDGTETWYCHLSSAKIRSGPVKAGDVIGYAGNSGNSTGPHLHFEVRPGGGSTIDPLAWLQSKGLDPR